MQRGRKSLLKRDLLKREYRMRLFNNPVHLCDGHHRAAVCQAGPLRTGVCVALRGGIRGKHPACTGTSIEDYRLPSVHEDPVFQMKAQGPGQDQPFEIPPLPDKVLKRIPVCYVG